MKLKLVCFIFAILLGFSKQSSGEINGNRPPFSLTLAQVEQWTPTSAWADANNVSRVSLQPRFIADLTRNGATLDDKVKVLIAPDGMNNLGNYLEEQPKFNLYNFTHWAYIDVLNWFAGTANETVSLPARPWVEVAHRNGVKVIGTVYLSVAQYGGDAATVARLLQQDAQGRFPMADKLVAIAQFYRFDGWLINPETDLTLVKNAQGEVIKDKYDLQTGAELGQKMRQFVAYLTKISPKPMEIHWYDSMLINGSVKWQNTLNQQNAAFFQDQEEAVSDAIFLNYWWDQAMVKQSHQFAKQLKRSPYELYFGADLSPARNAQRIFERSDWLSALFTQNPDKSVTGLSSIALFANDVNFTFTGDKRTPAISEFKQNKMDYRRFYEAEVKLFSGNDANVWRQDLEGNWPGISQFVPAKSVLVSLPFSTSFNTGHGLVKAQHGVMAAQEWHDMSKQDILPTWQFAIDGSDDVTMYYDFEQAYAGGNSLAIRAEDAVELVTMPLYQTAFSLDKSYQLSVTFKHKIPTSALWIWLKTQDKMIIKYPLLAKDNAWTTTHIDLSTYQGKVIAKIGLLISGHDHNGFATNLGALAIHD